MFTDTCTRLSVWERKHDNKSTKKHEGKGSIPGYSIMRLKQLLN